MNRKDPIEKAVYDATRRAPAPIRAEIIRKEWPADGIVYVHLTVDLSVDLQPGEADAGRKGGAAVASSFPAARGSEPERRATTREEWVLLETGSGYDKAYMMLLEPVRRLTGEDSSCGAGGVCGVR